MSEPTDHRERPGPATTPGATNSEATNTPPGVFTNAPVNAPVNGPVDAPVDGPGSDRDARVYPFPNRARKAALNPPVDDPDAWLDGPPEAAGVVIEGEIVGEPVDVLTDPPTGPVAGPDGAGRPGAVVAVRRAGTSTVRGTGRAVTSVYATGRTLVTHPHTQRSGKLLGRNLWYPVAGAVVVGKRWRDAHGASRYERMMRQAELSGDREALFEWESRDVAEKARRHSRVMDWVRSPLDLLKAVTFAFLGFAGLLLGLGVVLALADSDVSLVIAPITAVIDAIAFTVWFLSVYGATLLLAATAGAVALLWNTGRTRTEAPAWMAPPQAAAGRDVIPDENAVFNALRNLNLPAMNRKVREGWQPRWVQGAAHDGKGWRTQLLLPEGVSVEMIVDKKALLAHNLLRLPVEVWPTEPKNNPGVLDLWVADQGSLTKPVEPWPLLHEGTTDYFKGVPVGVNPRGQVVVGRLFQANWGVAGMMGSGKSTLIITMLLGAILDPLVEIDVYCMAINADYDPLTPRLRTLFKSDEPDDIPQVLVALKELMSDLSERGQLLSAAGEPKLTRALAEADPRMRPRVVVIDECQELFVSAHGEEAAELVEKIVAKARKYGVTLVFATPVPSADSLPRKVAKVLSNKACFAIGDHQGNDAILGTGKHKAGITATDLRPMTEDADGNVDLGDLGTAMAVGFTAADGLMRCFYVPRGNGIDEVTPVVTRAMALRADITTTEPTQTSAEADGPDLLVDVAEVLRAAGAELMRTQEVIAGLGVLNRDAYTRLTFTQLRDGLPEAAKPYKTKGVVQINARRVAEALADRDHQHDGGDDQHGDSHTL